MPYQLYLSKFIRNFPTKPPLQLESYMFTHLALKVLSQIVQIGYCSCVVYRLLQLFFCCFFCFVFFFVFFFVVFFLFFFVAVCHTVLLAVSREGCAS